MLPLRSAWATYNGYMLRRPVFTNAVTSGFVMLAGDAIAQRIEGNHKYEYV